MQLVFNAIATFALVLLSACGGGGVSVTAEPVVAPVVVDPLTPATATDLAQAATLYGIEASGVGGDSGGDGGAAGAAGDGAPLKRAVVTLVDAKGNQVSGLTDNNGKFLLKYQTKNFTAPLVLRVVTVGGNVLTSVSDVSATATKVVRANINFLTDKITSDILVASVGGTDKTFDGSKVDVTKLAKAKADLVTSINAALVSAGVADTSRFDPVTSVYEYDGTKVDAIIESLSLTRDTTTGATNLSAKLASLQNNADGSAVSTVVSASTPLATALVALPTSTALTFAKLDSWVNEFNRCLALTPAQFAADAACADADGSRLATTGYLANSADFREDFRTVFSNTDTTHIQGSTVRNPVLLFTTKYASSTATFDDLAVVELTIRQPSTGPLAGSVAGAIEYVKTVVFKRDDNLSRAKAGNWILNGNQRAFNFGVSTRYVKTKQMNATRANNSSGGIPDNYQSRINLSFSEFVFNKTTRTRVDSNVRAVRVTGPGLPSAGVVLVPSSVTGANSMAIVNKTGVIPTSTVSTLNSANSFGVAAVAGDGSPVYSGFFNPTGSTNATTMLTDFSALQAYARYQFEIFLRTNTSGVADFVQSTVNLAPVYAPSSVLGIPLNDIAPSASLATAPASSATAVTVAWINNLNAAPVYDVQVVSQARNPQGATTQTFTLTAYDQHASVASAYSLDVRPTSQAVAASSGFFPSLGSGVAGDFRQIAIWANQGRAIYQNLLRWDN
jgi:hypothetical protein